MTLPFRWPSFSLALWFRAFSEVCLRFPAPMLCAAVFTGSFIRLIHEGEADMQAIALLMAALLGLPVCVGLAAFAERLLWTQTARYALQSAGLLLAAGAYFWLQPQRADWGSVQVPRYLLLFVAAHLWVALAPYLRPRDLVADFWEYNKRLLTHFAVGALYAAVLFIGIALAIAAINALFDLNWDSKVYGYWFALLAGMFQTTFFLYHFPKNTLFSEEETGYPDLLRNLCQYVFVPIVGLYFFILYAYSIKILLTWALPRGWVASLVLGFSVAGIFTYLINYRLGEQAGISRWVLLYQRAFWWVLLPMVVLLGVAIGRRLSDYGVTPERFWVAHLGVWLLVVCVYFLWSKKDDIRFIPLSLALFLLSAIAGPFSAFEVSHRSQTGILKAIFEKNNAFENGRLKQDLSYLPEEDRERVRSIVYFLSEQGALERISEWLPASVSVAALDSLSSTYERGQVVLEQLRLTLQNSTVAYAFANKGEDTVVGFQIAGFRSLYWLNLYEPLSPAQQKKLPYVGLASSRKSLVVRLSSTQTTPDTLPLDRHLPHWLRIGQMNNATLPDSLTYLEWKKDSRVYRLLVREVWLEDREMRVQQMNGALLVK